MERARTSPLRVMGNPYRPGRLMAIDWTKLIQRAAKQGLKTFVERRSSAREGERPMVDQIRANLSQIPDRHHSQHDGHWLTVVDVENRVGTRYVCRCSRGYTVFVDEENIKDRQRVPEPRLLPKGHRQSCDKGL